MSQAGRIPIELRRRPIHPALTEEMIATLVGRFYEDIRADHLLGPIFDRVIGERWDPHLGTMRDFWSSVALLSGRYKGAPLPAHFRIGGLTERHFARWLELWRATAQAVCPPEAAELMIDRAERIARSFQIALFYRPADDDPGHRRSATATSACHGLGLAPA